MSTFVSNLGPDLGEYVARLKRVAERRLSWWERHFSGLRHLDPAKAQKCLDFLAEVHYHATAKNAFGEVEVYLCYGRWDMALEALASAVTGVADSGYPLAAEDRDTAANLLARMRAA